MGGGASPLNTGGGMSGGQTQTPSMGTSPFSSVNSTTQQDMMRGGSGMPFGQRLGQLGFGGQQTTSAPMQNPFQPQQQPLSFEQWRAQPRMQDQQFRTPEQQRQLDLQGYQQYVSGTDNMQVAQPVPLQNPFQPDSSMVAEEYPTVSHFGDMQYRPQRYDPIAAERNYYAQMAQQRRPQQPPPMQNPFQPQQPSYMQDPEYQGYQKQIGDLQRQMQEYMQKAPMYQQMRDLESKMIPFQQRHQQQEMQRMQQMQAMQQRQFQQPSPFRRGQFQQPTGIQGLMGMLGGRGGMQQPRMTMDMPQTNQPMETLPTSFPQTFGREQQYTVPAYSANYKNVSRAALAAREAAAKAAQEAASPAAPAYEQYYGGGL